MISPGIPDLSLLADVILLFRPSEFYCAHKKSDAARLVENAGEPRQRPRSNGGLRARVTPVVNFNVLVYLILHTGVTPAAAFIQT